MSSLTLFPEKKIPEAKLYQHTNLVNAQYDMSLYQMRIFLYMLSKINAFDKEFEEIRIPLSLICDSQGGKTQDILDDITGKLARWTFTFSKLEKNQRGKLREGTVSYPLLSKCHYVKGNPYVEAKFNVEFAPYLLDLKSKGNFTESDYLELSALKNFCSHRLYWLLKEKYKYGFREILVDELRYMLSLEDRYTKFNDFRTKVIDTAQKELAKTSIAFDYDLVKRGRNVEKIRFELLKGEPTKQLKAGKAPALTPPAPVQASLGFEAPIVNEHNYTNEQQSVFMRMLKYQLSETNAHKVMKKAKTLKEIHSVCHAIQLHAINNPQENLAEYSLRVFKKRFHI